MGERGPLSPLESGNHENTKHHVETFRGTVVEGTQGEKGLQVMEGGGERELRPGRKGVTRCKEGWFSLLAQERSGGRKHKIQTFLSFVNVM